MTKNNKNNQILRFSLISGIIGSASYGFLDSHNIQITPQILEYTILSIVPISSGILIKNDVINSFKKRSIEEIVDSSFKPYFYKMKKSGDLNEKILKNKFNINKYSDSQIESLTLEQFKKDNPNEIKELYSNSKDNIFLKKSYSNNKIASKAIGGLGAIIGSSIVGVAYGIGYGIGSLTK